MGANDYLSSLNYGTSTGGSAGSAETSSTLGTARIDLREPPDQNHISGLQITRLVELATLISSDLKGGCRLRVRKQTTNPFGATESGFYISQAGVPYYVIDGTATAITAGGGTTQTIDVINATAATGKTITSAVADAGTNVGIIFNNSTALTGTTLLASFRNNGVEKVAIADDGAILAPTIGPSATQKHALPAVASDTVALVAAAQTLTNKSISGATNTITALTSTSMAAALWWSPADMLQEHAVALSAGNFTMGHYWKFIRDATITGVRFWYPGPTSRTVKCTVYQTSDNALLANASVAVSTAGFYTATFGSPLAVAALNEVAVATYETTGANYWNVASHPWPTAPMLGGPSILATYAGVRYSAGDASPTTTAAGYITSAEPVFTVP